MAWPFTSVGAPNLDTGPGVAVPTSVTVVTASTAWLLGGHFRNNDSVDRIITVIDTAGKDLVGPLTIPAGAEQPYEWPFRPSIGVKWSADGANVTGHLWGYV